MAQITLCPTKAGKGFKVVHNNVWYYTSIGELMKVVTRKQACVFRTIDEIQKTSKPSKEVV